MNLDEWINYVFPDVENDDFSDWKYPDFYNEPIKDKSIICSYVEDVFLNIGNIYSRRNLNEIAYGLNYIVNPFVSLTAYALLDDSVIDEKKINAIKSMNNIFNFFEKQCDYSTNNLNYVCKMWWDFFPRHGTGTRNDSMKKIDREIMKIMSSLLKYKSNYCIESALHGLGHWHVGYPDEVKEIIENNIKFLPKELLEYAEKCKNGIIL